MCLWFLTINIYRYTAANYTATVSYENPKTEILSGIIETQIIGIQINILFLW